MATNENTRGGTHEQHVKAGQQSHKNDQEKGSNKESDDSKNNQSTASGEGRGWHGDPEGHAEAGRKGGEAVSKDSEHMAEIGRKGGEAVSEDREHMAEIGRKGGEARGNSDSDSEGSDNKSRSSQGGTHEQHVAVGKQSHKNDK